MARTSRGRWGVSGQTKRGSVLEWARPETLHAEGILDYRRLGRTGLMVSELCLGCMTFGRELSEEGVSRLSEASSPPDIYPYNIIRDVQRI